MHGVSEDFGATISAVFDEANPTIPFVIASQVPFFAFPIDPFSESRSGALRVHKSKETIAVIALSATGFWPLTGSIPNERQRLIQIVLRIASHAPLRSTIGFILPIPTQHHGIPHE
jgi:hypothetical protein